MKQVIYIDVLIFLNVFVNYFLLLSVSLLLRTNVRKHRILSGAFIGGIFSLSALLPEFSAVFSVLLRIFIATVLVIITFGYKTFQFFIKHFFSLLISTFLFAGLMNGIWLIFRPNGMIYKNSAIYFDVSIWLLVISTVCCYIAVTLVSRLFSRNPHTALTYKVLFEINGIQITAEAMLDTGNTLTEIFTGYPVLICTYRLIEKDFPEEMKTIFRNGLTNDTQPDENWIKKIRLVSLKTVSGNSNLVSFRPDSLIIKGLDYTKETNEAYIAVSNKSEYINEKFDMLINPKILN